MFFSEMYIVDPTVITNASASTMFGSCADLALPNGSSRQS